MLIVEEDQSKPKTSPAFTKYGAPSYVREILCLCLPGWQSQQTTPVSFPVCTMLKEGGVLNPACAPEMRRLIAQIVASDPDFIVRQYWENKWRVLWLDQKGWHLGGAIETSILSKFYQCEICVVDTQTVRIDRFGEDAGYTKRVLLIYDGIHYDPPSVAFPDPDTPPLTIFSPLMMILFLCKHWS